MSALSESLVAAQRQAIAAASKLIEQLQAGTYNPDEWTVPF